MDLPNLFNVNVAQAGQRVCVLVLTNQSVLAGLLVVHPSGSQLLRISELIPYTDDSSLLLAADEVLQELGKESEDVNEVVFCLEQNWFDQAGELLTEKQALLKRVKEELSLQPVGYVLQHETVTEHLINQQRQISGLVLFLSAESITATLVMQGSISAAVTVGRSGEIQSDVVEALTRAAKEAGKVEMPGKLLCATVSLEVAELFELQQELLTVIWPPSVSFLQLPVVEVIKPQLTAQIVVTGAGKALRQIEGDIAPNVLAPATIASVDEADAKELVKDDVSNVEPIEAATTVTPHEEYAIDSNITTASSFGIPIKSAPEVTFTQTPTPMQKEETAVSVNATPTHSAPSWLTGLKHNRHKPSKRHFIIVSIFAGIVGLLVVALLGYVYLSRTATLQLRIQPKITQISQEVQLTLDPTLKETDVENRKVRAERLEVELSASQDSKATGIKIVGEKATGTVVIFNKTTAVKSFAAGTILRTKALEYVLVDSVEVPAATISAKPGGTGEEKEYGQRSTKATATVIGVENNIEKDVQLTIADFDSSTYAAKTETALSGGSSREVRVVSQTDMDILVADLKKTLLADAKKQLEAKRTDDQRVIPLDTLTVVKEVFSAKEGDEVDSVSLDLTIKAVGLAYYTTDLDPIAEALLSGLLPEGYSLEGHTPQILSAGETSGSSQVIVTVNLSSKAHALIEVEQLREQLASKSLTDAAALLASKPSVEKASFIVLPQLARSLVKTVPTDASRFDIELSIQD
ncbi:hypothetical protein KA012_02395 [Candidatus Woesebacteria bacterium]|nr:hypothetical protein [Candidatus Woesebacteria bacterium]